MIKAVMMHKNEGVTYITAISRNRKNQNPFDARNRPHPARPLLSGRRHRKARHRILHYQYQEPHYKEGWKWVEIRPSYDYGEWSKCERRFEEAVPLPDDLQQEYEALREEYNAMIDSMDETDPQVTSRLDEIEARMSELDDRATMWPPETLAIAGAVVYIGHKGEADIHRGFVLPEDKPKKQAKSATTTTTDAEGNITTVETESASPHSAALIEDLTAHRSAAISAALLDRPEIALAAVVHTMARQVFFDADSRDSSLKLSVSAPFFRRVEGSQAFESLEAARVG